MFQSIICDLDLTRSFLLVYRSQTDLTAHNIPTVHAGTYTGDIQANLVHFLYVFFFVHIEANLTARNYWLQSKVDRLYTKTHFTKVVKS